eukprot:1730380-Prymnesium_polylepis.1
MSAMSALSDAILCRLSGLCQALSGSVSNCQTRAQGGWELAEPRGEQILQSLEPRPDPRWPSAKSFHKFHPFKVGSTERTKVGAGSRGARARRPAAKALQNNGFAAL